MDNFRLEVELENGKELKVASYFGEGLTIDELDELKSYLYEKTEVIPPQNVPLLRSQPINKPTEPDYIQLLDTSPEKFFKLLVLEKLQTAKVYDLPENLRFLLEYSFNYFRVCHVVKKSTCLFCAIDEYQKELGPLTYFRGILFADKSHVYGIIRFDNLGSEFTRIWNALSKGSKLYLNQKNKMLLVRRFRTDRNGEISTPGWQDFFTSDLAAFVKKYQSTIC